MKPASADGSQKSKSRPAKPKQGFPWLLLLLLLASLYAFWILPIQLGPRPVRVEFQGASGK